MNSKIKLSIGLLSVFALAAVFTLTSMTMKNKQTNAYLEITLNVKAENRSAAGSVYVKYKQPFLDQVEGATSKELLMRAEDVQVLHGFENEAMAKAYLNTKLFQDDVVRELKPYLDANPEARIYSVFRN